MRKREGCFLIEGIRAIEQVATQFPSAIDEILSVDGLHNSRLLSEFSNRQLTESQLNTICSSQTPQGILAVVRLPEQVYSSDLPQETGTRILLLEHVQDPGNVGTLIRTAAALDYSGVLLSNQCADPFSSKVVQATAGSLLSVWIRRTDRYMDVLSQLKTDGYVLCAADIDGEDHIDFSSYPKHVIALGNEGSGLSTDILRFCNTRFRIPFNSSRVESLNVAVSGAIAMFCVKSGFHW